MTSWRYMPPVPEPVYCSVLQCTAVDSCHMTMLLAVQCWGLTGSVMMGVRLPTLCIILDGLWGALLCMPLPAAEPEFGA